MRETTLEYTVKAYARREQVAERTVRRWIEKGAVAVRRTPGGGVRIVECDGGDSRAVFFATTDDKRGQLSQ